jgi:hypothetical protein
LVIHLSLAPLLSSAYPETIASTRGEMPTMNVQLILQRKGKQIWRTQLRRVVSTLGRAYGCTIRIPSSEVSRLHCRLRIENDLVTVEDLESVNGTFLNGRRIRAVEIVRPGDCLALGPATFLVDYQLTPLALQQLGAGEEYVAVEPADDELEVVEDALPLVEALEEVRETPPMRKALAKVEETDEDMLVFDEGEEINLPEGGDLHDFLLELDDTDERDRKRRN